MKSYFVYILTNQARGTLYIGVTNNLRRRYEEHFAARAKGFTQKHGLKRLVYFEEAENIEAAIEREKQLKRWHRQWKINLIESVNPHWDNLGRVFGMDAETSSA